MMAVGGAVSKGIGAAFATTHGQKVISKFLVQKSETSSNLHQAKKSAIKKEYKNPYTVKDKAPEKLHGNNKQYVGETHVYVIRDAEGNIYKVGESMRGVNKFNLSKRAEEQAKKLQKTTGQDFKTEIRRTFSTKRDAREYETKLIERYRNVFGDDKLPGNKGNR